MSEQRTKLKICGITNLEDARFSSGMMVDYLGFIFYEKSPRYIEPAKAGAIINWIEGPEAVGVFVNQPLDDVNAIAKETGLGIVQLHGSESPEYCELVEKPVIKVIHVEEGATKDTLKGKIQPYIDTVDYFMFDSKIGDQWGGTGKVFDWSLIKDIIHDKPFFLSGGLNTENIREAIKTVHPFAIDLSSSLEAEPGLKDFDKMEVFNDEIRDIWELEEEGNL